MLYRLEPTPRLSAIIALLTGIIATSQVYRAGTLAAHRLNRMVLYVPQQVSRLVDPVESQEAPKWINSCDFTETPFANSRPNWNTKTRPRRQAESSITSEIIISGPPIRFERSANLTRKMSTSQQEHPGEMPLTGDRQTNADHKANIIFKLPRFGAKKTTFSSAKTRKVKKNHNQKHHYKLTTPLLSYVSPEKHVVEVKIAKNDTAKNPTQVQMYDGQDASINALLSQLSINSLKLAWIANSALNQAKEAEQVGHRLQHALAYELDDQADSARHGREPKRKWLPGFEQLIRYGPKGNRSLSAFIGNMTDYFQYFGVAFEQISFERIKFDAKHQNSFTDLDISAAKLVCSLERLKPQLVAIENDTLQLIQLVEGKNVSLDGQHGLAQYLNSTLMHRVERLEANGGLWLDSPKPSQANQVDRQVMPAIERSLANYEERSERDCSILVDFNKTLRLYQTFLAGLLEA